MTRWDIIIPAILALIMWVAFLGWRHLRGGNTADDIIEDELGPIAPVSLVKWRHVPTPVYGQLQERDWISDLSDNGLKVLTEWTFRMILWKAEQPYDLPEWSMG